MFSRGLHPAPRTVVAAKCIGRALKICLINMWKSRIAADRTTPRRKVELVAICQDFLGVNGPGISVTISTEGKIRREVILGGDLVEGIRKAATWIEEMQNCEPTTGSFPPPIP